MRIGALLKGIGLQAGAAVIAWAGDQLFYAAGWLVTLVISVPMWIASIVVLMRSEWPLALRLLLSFWILLVPLYQAIG